MSTELLKTLGAILSNPWWAAVLLGIGMFLHFMRDAAIEKRIGKLLEDQIDATKLASESEVKTAAALTDVASKLERLENTVFRKINDKEKNE